MDVRNRFRQLLLSVLLIYARKYVDSADDDSDEESEKNYTVVQHGPKSIIIVTNDGSGDVAEGEDRFEIQKRDKWYDYVVKPGQKCVRVEFEEGGFKCLERVIWSHDKEVCGDHHPSAVYFNPEYMVFTIYFNDDWYYTYLYDPDRYRFKVSSSVETGRAGKKEGLLGIFFQEAVGGPGVEDTTKYEVLMDDEASYYKFAEAAKCQRIEYSGEVIWTQDELVSSPVRPIGVAISKKEKMSVVFNKFFMVYQNVDGWRLTACILDLEQEDIINIRVVDDPSKGDKDATVAKIQYVKTVYGYEYEIPKGVVCQEVRGNCLSIWNRDCSRHPTQLPEKVILNPFLDVDETVIIKFEQKELYYRYLEDEWILYRGKIEKKEEHKSGVAEMMQTEIEGSEDTSHEVKDVKEEKPKGMEKPKAVEEPKVEDEPKIDEEPRTEEEPGDKGEEGPREDAPKSEEPCGDGSEASGSKPDKPESSQTFKNAILWSAIIGTILIGMVSFFALKYG